MVLHGDTGTLQVTDLLQNLEVNRRSGTLRVKGARSTTELYFYEGKLSLLASDGRPTLMEVLVGAGMFDAETLEAARKKRRRTRKSLGETLVALEAIDANDLAAIAQARLLADACELISEVSGEFEFEPGPIQRGVFDPEERRLGIALPVGPVLLEAARRSDHWPLIRSRVPSDSMYFAFQREPRWKDDCDLQLAQALVARIDGTRSVAEAVAPFVYQRFEVYQLLAHLAETGAIRPIGPDEMVALVRQLATTDEERAWFVLDRAVQDNPHHTGLLSELARSAEERGEHESAVDALKMIGHLSLEAGEDDEAREALARALALAPADTAIAERLFACALEAERKEEAIEHGRRLAELYRAPGLHKKAAGVLEKLHHLDPDAWDLRKDWALARGAAGEQGQAVESLQRFGRQRVQARDYEQARAAFETILELDPSHEEAQSATEKIDKGLFEASRLRWRRRLHRALLATVSAVLLTGLVIETRARRAWSRADERIGAENMIERGRYADAADLLEQVRQRHGWSSIARFDLPGRIAQLRAKHESREPWLD